MPPVLLFHGLQCRLWGRPGKENNHGVTSAGFCALLGRVLLWKPGRDRVSALFPNNSTGGLSARRFLMSAAVFLSSLLLVKVEETSLLFPMLVVY